MFTQLCKQHFPIILFWKPTSTSKIYNHAVTYNHAIAVDNLRIYGNQSISCELIVFIYFSLRKLIVSHWLKNILPQLLSLQLCLFRFRWMIKLCQDICSAWLSHTSVKILFHFSPQIDVISVVEYNKYLRSAEVCF